MKDSSAPTTPRKLDTLWVRAVTGLGYIAVLLGALLSGYPSVLSAIFAVMIYMAVIEYQSVTQTNRYEVFLGSIHALMGVILYFAIILNVYGAAPSYLRGSAFVIFYGAYVLFGMIGEMYRKRPNPIDTMGKALLGHLYIVVPFAIAYHLYAALTPHYQLLMPIFVMVWLNDSGAYLVGSMIGRHKLLERISPKKTIEGTIGGIVSSLIGAVIFHCVRIAPHLSLTAWCVIGVLTGIAATAGDLFESFIKRTYGAKDSGKILPGHGGILDRVDSLLIVLPVVYLLLYIIGTPL